MKKVLYSLIVLFLVFSFNLEAIEKKKIVMIKDDDSEFFDFFATTIGEMFKAKGYTEENSEYIVFSMQGKAERGEVIVKNIREINPDVVLLNATQVNTIVNPLYGSNIPIVLVAAMEHRENGKKKYVDENGYPNSNVTGTYAMPENFYLNSLKFLEKIAPITDKKAVLLVQDLIDEPAMREAFEEMGVEIKDYQIPKYFEDFQDLLKKYNDDPEVGWIIADGPTARKDGRENDRAKVFEWEYEEIKKPHVIYWQNNVEHGAMAGLAFDSMDMVLKCMEMCYKILEGEQVKNIKAEYPEKALILLNKQTLDRLNIEISMEVLQAAWRVYTDNKGHYIGKE